MIAVGERRALVIASQCESLNLLSFLPEAARDVADALLDPDVGGCVPALEDGRRMLVDPTAVELDDAVVAAFERAHEDEATLFLALVGHGDYADDDFYFLTRDGTSPPDSRRSFHLAQRVKELLGRYSLLDGLVILLDTCHAGVAASQAAARWVEIVGKAGKRFEVLTASDERAAANGCFSRSLASILRSGHPELGERLRCPDLKRLIAGLCPSQTAVHLAFDGVRTVMKGDQGLWLAVNTSDTWRPLRGNPSAAEIERLTEDYRPTAELRTVAGHLLMGTRCVAVTGRDNAVLLAALARPAVASGVIPARLLHAVVFLTAGQTVEQIAQELARQLRRTVPGFAAAAERYETTESALDSASAFERAVHGPLLALEGGSAVLAVNGLEWLDDGDRARLVQALTALAEDPALDEVQLVVADLYEDFEALGAVVQAGRHTHPAETEVHYPHPESSELPFDELEEDVYEYVEPDYVPPIRPPFADHDRALLNLLGATTFRGPLPIGILATALGLPTPHVRDALTRLGEDEVVRTQAGTPDETASVVPSSLWADFPPRPDEAARIAGAIAETVPGHETPEQRYATANEAEYLWLANLPEDAVRSLEERPLAIPVENRERWATWANRVRNRFGREHPLTIRVFARHATWMGKSGNREGALARFEELLPVAEQVLDPGDPEIFSIRNNIAYLLGELGRPEEARDAFRSLAEDTRAVLGPDHLETLHARHLHAVAAGKSGGGAESLRLGRELLPEAGRALGESHEIVLNIQHNILYWRTEIDAPPPRSTRAPTAPRPFEGDAR